MDRKHHRSRAIGAVVALGLVLGHAKTAGASDLPDIPVVSSPLRKPLA